MAFTRRAILIAAPGGGPKPAHGTRVDVAAWQNYLTSPAGGAWNDDEILPPLTHPSKDELDDALASADGCDYAVVTFSGHGGTKNIDGEPTTVLQIAPSLPLIPYYELKPRCARILLILDSCRSVLEEEVGVSKMAGRLMEKSIEERLIRQMHRDIYEKIILRTERGTITLFGCDYNEEADDMLSETQYGGLYTHKLIGAGDTWYSSAAKGMLNVYDAHLRAERDTTGQNRLQHPKILHGRRLGIFPFAVKA